MVALFGTLVLVTSAFGDTSFGETESPASGYLTEPAGVGVDPQNGDVYVATGFKHRIAKFDADGNPLFAFGWGIANEAEEEQTCTMVCEPGTAADTPSAATGGALDEAEALAVDPTAGEHDLYVSDPGYKRIEKFKPNGEFLLSFGGDVVAYGPDNSSNDEREKLTVAAEGGSFKLRFEYPWSIAYNGSTIEPATGSLNFGATAAEVEAALNGLSTVNGAYVSGGKIKVSGGPGNSTGSHPYEITFEGNLSGDDVPQLRVVNELSGATHTATVETLQNGGGPEVCRPSAGDVCKRGGLVGSGLDGTFSSWSDQAGVLAVAPEGTPFAGDVYVGDANRVQRFSPEGASLGKLELPGAGVTEAIAVGSTGDLYVVSENAAGVKVFEPSGGPLFTLTPPGRPKTLATDQSGNVFVGTELHHGEPEVAFEFLAYNLSGANYAQFSSSLLNSRWPVNEHRYEFVVGGAAVGAAAHRFYASNRSRGGHDIVAALPLPEPGAPLVKEESTSNEEPTTATLHAAINSDGFETAYRFQYIPKAECEKNEEEGGECFEGAEQTSVHTLAAFIHDVPVSAAASGLLPKTAYRYRAVAENECEPVEHPGHICTAAGVRGEADEEIAESFTTLPSVSIRGFVTQIVGPETVTFKADLNPNGAASHWMLCIGEEGEGGKDPYSHGCQQGNLALGNQFVELENEGREGVAVTGLDPNTTYHYKLTAENAYGLVETPDQTLTTEETSSEENAGADCGNHALREVNNSLRLPDCRAYEQVTPAEKSGYPVQLINENDYGLAPSGERALFETVSGFAGDSGVPTYFAHRTEGGWVSRNAIGRPAGPEFQPLTPSEFTAELDASLFKVGPGSTSEETNAGEITNSYYLGRADGTFVKVSPTIEILSGERDGNWDSPYGQSADLAHIFLASRHRFVTEDPRPDEGKLDRIYEVSGAGSPAPTLRLVVELGSGLTAANNCEIGTAEANSDGQLGRQFNPSSADGSILFYTADFEAEAGTACGGHHPNKAAVFACDVAAGPCVPGLIGAHAPVQLSAPFGCSSPHPCSSEPLAPATAYENSPSGRLAWFTTAQPLVNSDSDAGEGEGARDLYLARLTESGQLEELVQASHGEPSDPTPGVGDSVQGPLGISQDGTHAAFVATGVLTTQSNDSGYPVESHEVAAQGADNLYVYDAESGQVKFVARLCSGPEESGSVDDPSCPATLSHGSEGPTVRNDQFLWHVGTGDLAEYHLTPSGRYLVFKSYARLEPGDSDAAADVYRYDFETGRLIRVSFGRRGNAADGNDGLDALLGQQGAAWTLNAAAEDGDRSISADGSLVIFRTASPLVSFDTDAVANPGCESEAGNNQSGCDLYQWQEDGHGTCHEAGGCISLVSSGLDPHAVDGAVISSSGRDIIFTTPRGLVPGDSDGVRDIYDAREGGGFPFTVPPPMACQEGSPESCHGRPTEQQAPPSFTSQETRHGPEGTPEGLRCAKGKHKVRRHGQVRCVASGHRKHRAHHRKRLQRRINPNLGGGK